jgi:hypothetical protein
LRIVFLPIWIKFGIIDVLINLLSNCDRRDTCLSESRALLMGEHAVAQLVKALRYKPEGCGFDSQWCYCRIPSGRNMALESTQPLTGKSTRNISWGERGPVRRAENLANSVC